MQNLLNPIAQPPIAPKHDFLLLWQLLGFGRIAQRESTSLTSKGSLVQSQLRPPFHKGWIKLKQTGAPPRAAKKEKAMKVKNSLRSLKARHRDCRVVRRKGRVYVINKTQRRFKARQG